MAPTDAGRRLTEHARELLDRLERVEQEMAEFGAAQRGTVRVVADAAVAERLLVPLMVRAAKDRPLVEVRVEVASATDDTAALVRRVREACCDLALGGRHAFEPRPAAAGLDVLDLGLADLRVVLHAGHPGADGGTVDPAVLAGERWVTGPAGSASERCLLELCAAAGFCPDVGYRSTSWPLALGLVRAGRATTLTTRALSGEDGSVAVRRPSGETGRHHLLAVTRRDPDPATAYGLHVVRAALDAETAAETAGSA